jgi:tetratricopeptide (TPR) repeat protein
VADLGSDIKKAIQQKDIRAVTTIFFPSNSPKLGPGLQTETELWEYKSDCPHLIKESTNAWANLSKDICAFHNRLGGIIIFGIDNLQFSFCGCRERLDSKLVNDQVRRYLGDKIWVDYHREFIQRDQKYIGILLIPQRGPTVLRFLIDSPTTGGKKLFSRGDTALRNHDSCDVIRGHEADEYARSTTAPVIGEQYAVNVEFFRILAPEYSKFIDRPDPCHETLRGLKDPRTSVTSLVGIGGVGKTALATWATLKAYYEGMFDLIISVTAKDRELTSSGITALEPSLTSYESLLDSILEVTGFIECKGLEIEKKEKEARTLLLNSNGLLYVDNLETVDDNRIIKFLDDLPSGVRAITTSRRTTVRVAVRPVDIGPMTGKQILEFIRVLSDSPGFAYLKNLSDPEILRIGEACDGIPLAIRWAMSRASVPAEALSIAEGINKSGRKGDELLEFTFRRVFDSMPGAEKSILQVLSLFQRPLQSEAILIGSGLPQHRLQDAIETLVNDALVQRYFDENLNDYCYGLLPITRTFVYSDVSRNGGVETSIRKGLTDYFEAKDIGNLQQRMVIRELRQGKSKESEITLLDLGKAAERKGDLKDAENLYRQALARNPISWKAARILAEFQRHQRNNTAESLQLYEQAAANAPSRGKDRALIYREWGMLLRDSGVLGATEQAIDKFEIALQETPNDPIALHALAHMVSRVGNWARVIELLEPIKNHPSIETRQKVHPLLLKAYHACGEMLKEAELKSRPN